MTGSSVIRFAITLLVLLPVLIGCMPDQKPVVMTGMVVKVADGDSLTVLIAGKEVKVRLAEIDAPEREQPGWLEAKLILQELVADQQLEIHSSSKDRYQREVAQIYVNDIWINWYLLRNGYAWVYTDFAQSEKLLEAQLLAQKEKLGLWSLPESEQVPPWRWRKMH